MTLILIAANRSFVVQVSDRRLTSGGASVTDEETKAIYLQTPNSQMLIGYTGIARLASKSTNQVIQELLTDTVIKRAGLDPSALVRELAVQLGDYLTNGPGSSYGAEDRRLSVSLTGFVHTDGGWSGPVQALLTNFQVWGRHDEPRAGPVFTHTFFEFPDGIADADATLIQKLGRWDVIADADMESVRALLAPGKPPSAARDKMVSLVDDIGQREETVGRQMNAVILRPGNQPEWTYQSAVNSPNVHFGDSIIVDENLDSLAVRGAMVHLEGEGFLVVPRRNRRAKCACGSGLRYRDCHGKRI